MKQIALSALLTGALCIYTCPQNGLHGQETTDLDSLYAELDELFAEDSISDNLFALTDSLLAMMDMRFHSISLRGSFTSEVLTSGRDLGYSQQGMIAGASYYHPSGLYADVTGYLNSEYSPRYYLTDAGIGYLLDLEHWMLQAGHNFQFFDSSVDWLFNKNIHGSAYYQRKFWEAGVDYRYMYGKESAHRITSTMASRFTWKAGWIHRISLIPSVAVQWGNANIIYFRQSDTPLADLYSIILENEQYPDLDRDEMIQLAYLLHRDRYGRALQLLLENGYTTESVASLVDDYQNSQLNETNSFGLMNIALNLGASLSRDRWNLYINYSYNFPQALPGEQYDYENNDYLSISIFCTLIWPAKTR